MINRTNETKAFWDWVEQFQSRPFPESPSQTAGLLALRKIRSILEPLWVDFPGRPHPLRTKFHLAYEPNYVWFCHLSRKLEEMTKIPGYETVLARLGIPEEFANAWAELEVALRVHLSKFPCRFVRPADNRTPDIETEMDGITVQIEVSSLNQASEDRLAMDIGGVVFPHQPGFVAGGSLSWVPNQREFEKIRKDLMQAINKAIENNEFVRINDPGQLLYYIAPQNQAHLIPPMWRGHFAMATKTPKPKKDRLLEKIDSKAKGQLSSSKPSALVVYDRFWLEEEIQQLSENWDVSVKIATLPSLACVVLVAPLSPFAIITVSPRKERKNGVTYLEQPLPDREAEKCIVWENPSGDYAEVCRSMVDSFATFSQNLMTLFRN